MSRKLKPDTSASVVSLHGLMQEAALAVDTYCDSLEKQAWEEFVSRWREQIIDKSPDIWIDPDVSADLHKTSQSSGHYVWSELNISENVKRWDKCGKFKLHGKPLASKALTLTKEQQQEKMKSISADVNVRYAEAFLGLAERGHTFKPRESIED